MNNYHMIFMFEGKNIEMIVPAGSFTEAIQTFCDVTKNGLVMTDGVARKVEFPRIGQRITCPNCEIEFALEDKSNG